MMMVLLPKVSTYLLSPSEHPVSRPITIQLILVYSMPTSTSLYLHVTLNAGDSTPGHVFLGFRKCRSNFQRENPLISNCSTYMLCPAVGC